jgi:hypothetical protein
VFNISVTEDEIATLLMGDHWMGGAVPAEYAVRICIQLRYA